MSAHDQLTREEAIEKLDEYERKQMILESRIDSLTKTVHALHETVVGDDASASEYDEKPITDRLTQVEANTTVTATQSNGLGETKADLAYHIAQKEGLRVSTKGISGGAVDWPTVRDIADREHDTELHSGTVYTAFDRLAEDWDCFNVNRGGDGPNTKNKVLECTREKITAALRTAVTNNPN